MGYPQKYRWNTKDWLLTLELMDTTQIQSNSGSWPTINVPSTSHLLWTILESITLQKPPEIHPERPINSSNILENWSVYKGCTKVRLQQTNFETIVDKICQCRNPQFPSSQNAKTSVLPITVDETNIHTQKSIDLIYVTDPDPST